MTKRIFRSTLLVAVIVLLASAVLLLGCLYDYFGGVEKNTLAEELELASAGVEADGVSYLEALPDDVCRVTWIAPDGTVRYDSETDAAGMENHADRQEVRDALRTGIGSSERYSATLMEKTVYRAARLSDGSVLRVSRQQAAILLLVVGMLQPVLLVAVLAIILSALLSKRMAKKITAPFEALDLAHPLENDTYPELSPMLGKINRQHREISLQLAALQKKTEEFAQVTSCMREALVLLDENGWILSINPAAQRLFAAGAESVGQDFLTVERSAALRGALLAAKRDGHSEMRMTRGGRIYQFDISRTESGGSVTGLVLLAFDVTEQVQAEENRRAFTANVSHELKTPLQSVLGSAELIEDGVVKPEDLPRFAGHIRREAARLLALIEDILQLSRLDEGEALAEEDADLGAVAAEAAEALQQQAETAGVTLKTDCACAKVHGVRRLLYEIVYNLCDNAIKYNHAGGSVCVAVTQEAESAVLTVEDSGSGIPEADQPHVFERFYRVDKSHSREQGGTGLGLSIVKHAALYHHAAISLSSKEGIGTTITVRFPAAEQRS